MANQTTKQRSVPSKIECYKCQNRGHLAKIICRSKKQLTRTSKSGNRQVRYLEEQEESKPEESDSQEFLVSLVTEVGEIKLQIQIPVKVDGVCVEMELDTGAAVTIVSESLYKQHWPGRRLDDSSIHYRHTLKYS